MAGQITRIFLRVRVIKAAAGRNSGRRRSLQIVEKVKNPEITLIQCNFHGKPFRNPDALGGMQACPRRCGIPIMGYYLNEKSHNFE
jgi:hypothetical protein